MLVLGLAHSILGERYILRRLFRRTDLPPLFGSDDFTKRTLRFAWHLTSVAWWGLAVLMLALGMKSVRGGLLIVSATAFVSALVAAVGSRGRHLAWPVFLLVGLGAWLGAPPR
jgi:hypothetical protein